MMKLSLDANGCLSIFSACCSLSGISPVINGKVLDCLPAQPSTSSDRRRTFHFSAGYPDALRFYLVVDRAADRMLTLRYGLEDSPPEPLDSFGLHISRVENLRAFLRSGYFSWDGSYYVQAGTLTHSGLPENQLETGYAMTQLLPRQGSGSLVIGFDRHDRFQHTFTFDTHPSPLALTIQTWWDRKQPGAATLHSERLLIFEHPGIEEALRAWAHRVAEISPAAPRLPAQPITGWNSWYYLYAYINEENILEHLQAAASVSRREDLPLRVFQIDDGFTPEMGDWLEVKPQFPGGMAPLLARIRQSGFIPGLWIAPFMVGNRSHLYQQHPDWVVKDRDTRGPLVQQRFYGEFRWHKRSEEYYILDVTHPEAFEYLRHVFHTWRHAWGCGYFKTDFMHYGSEHGPQRAVWHTPGSTRIETWRKTAEMIRTEIGDALWLGCGCPLWAAVGLVDAMRTGGDVGVEWQGNVSAPILLRDQATRNFANGILWQADPDAVLLRDRFHYLSDVEVRSLAVYAGMLGGVMTTSDNLAELPEERLGLWRLILPEDISTCRFPFLGHMELAYKEPASPPPTSNNQSQAVTFDPMVVQVRTGWLSQSSGKDTHDRRQASAIFIINTSEETLQRTYPLSKLDLPRPAHVFDWFSNEAWPDPVEEIAITLSPHSSALLLTSQEQWDFAPDRLPGGRLF